MIAPDNEPLNSSAFAAELEDMCPNQRSSHKLEDVYTMPTCVSYNTVCHETSGRKRDFYNINSLLNISTRKDESNLIISKIVAQLTIPYH